MEEENATLRRQLAEMRRLHQEEQRQLAEVRRLRQEEQKRREAAEAVAKQSLPQNLVGFLKSCHHFSVTLPVVTDKTLTTQGDTTKPAGRLFPQCIAPWKDFADQQEVIWEKLSMSAPFTSQRVYPSADQLDYVQRYLYPISSEFGLQSYARDTVENPVRTLIQEIYKNEQLRELLRLGGTLMFESHTDLGQTSESLILEDEAQMTRSKSHTSERGTKGTDKDARGGSRGITRNADQFCIYELADGQRVPVVLGEYKAPHKLPLAEIIAGLRGEIQPAEEIINKEGDDLDFLSKSLVAAVITQLFSSMIGKGVQRGYVSTGEATIFLYIPDDPSTIQYHLSIPSLDFQADDENRLHRTSVAQIAAFALNALAANAPSQSWHDATANLDTWSVEYIDILKKIPETVRKAPRHPSYKPDRWKGFSRSPIRTRARRLALACDKVNDQFQNSGDEGDEGDDNDNHPPTPIPHRVRRTVQPRNSASAQQSEASRDAVKSDATDQDEMEAISKWRIEDRPYCTHRCLLGMTSGGALDNHCPNIKDHQGQHLQLETFLSLIRAQLANDRGRDADCKPLYIKGSRGALAKIRLSSHGYTVVAKAMKRADRQYLLHEAAVYGRLHSLQGSHIPVCLGMLDLELPFYYDYGVYASMLVLSWAGRPLHQYLNRENEACVLGQVSETLTALHKHQILHKDPELRNWLWDEQRDRIMLVDFERAGIQARSPLSIPSPNRKRKRQAAMTKGVEEADEFDREIRSARGWISRGVRP